MDVELTVVFPGLQSAWLLPGHLCGQERRYESMRCLQRWVLHYHPTVNKIVQQWLASALLLEITAIIIRWFCVRLCISNIGSAEYAHRTKHCSQHTSRPRGQMA